MKQGATKPTDNDLDTAFRSSASGLRAITSRVDGDEADLAQEACLKLIEASHKETIHTPVHLLYRLARNLVIDRLRNRAVSKRIFRQDEPHAQHASASADPERTLLASERLHRALQLIDTMPARRRQALLLHRIDGMSYLEIARTMGISVKTVEKHLSAAILELTEKMHAYDIDR